MADEKAHDHSPRTQLDTSVPQSARVWNYWLGTDATAPRSHTHSHASALAHPPRRTLARTTAGASTHPTRCDRTGVRAGLGLTRPSGPTGARSAGLRRPVAARTPKDLRQVPEPPFPAIDSALMRA